MPILTANGTVGYSYVKTAEYNVSFTYKFYSGEKNGVLIGLRVKRIWVARFEDGVAALKFWNQRALSNVPTSYTQPPYYCDGYETPIIHAEYGMRVRF